MTGVGEGHVPGHVTGSHVALAQGHVTVTGLDRGRGGVVMTAIGERGGRDHPRGGGGATGLGAEDTPPVGGAGNRFITHTLNNY